MCGICGELSFKDPARVSPERVQRMTRMLAHRGPDSEGLWGGPGIALGHRRLSIIDLSDAASQPMATPDGRFRIVFNGQVYNFVELRAELESLGERFTTRSDTEVLLRALAVWGREALVKLNGMWAFALWDGEERKLTLCRDRFGVKPLYWARVEGGVVFASEIPPLVLHPEVSREVHLRALAEQVACRYVLAPRTLLKSVQKLPPGHTLTVTEEGLSVAPYFRLPVGDRVERVGEGEALERFTELFEASVQRRLVADVPVGILLSGGVDSSALAAAVRNAGVPAMSSFTVGFDAGERYDERAWAREVAQRLGTRHHEVMISPERFLSTLPEVLAHLDDPVADVAVLPLYHVCGLAKESVTVLLSGQGADEILGGYHLDRVLAQIRSFVLLRGLPGARRAARFLARRNSKRAYLERWEDIRHAVPGQLPGKIRYDLTMPLPPVLMDRLVKDCMRPPYDRTLDAFYTEVPSHRGPLDAILSTLTKGWLADNLLNHSDRMSMAHSLELRVPFLDPVLVPFLFTLPQRLKVHRGTTKYLLKKYAVRAGVPKANAFRRKKGFPVPWNAWLRGPLKEPVREILEGATWLDRYFFREGIRSVFAEHQDGTDHGFLLWNLTVLAHWGQRML